MWEDEFAHDMMRDQQTQKMCGNVEKLQVWV